MADIHEFQEVEDGALAALQTSLAALGVKTFAAYSGELSPQEIQSIAVNFPCVYIFCGSLAVTDRNQNDIQELELSFLVGDRNTRGPQAAMRGDEASPGINQILLAIRAGIHKKKLPGRYVGFLRREAAITYSPRESFCLYEAIYALKRAK